MPASLTHYTFVKDNISRDDTFFRVKALGGQGPDVFFFYGYSFHKRENIKEVQQFGTLLHHSNISLAYTHLLEYAQKSAHKDMLLSYIEGLLMHYVLDRNVHPYVFYRTGFSSDVTKQKEFSLSHIAFETIMDVYYSRLHHTFQKPSRVIKMKHRDVLLISEMFCDLASFLKYKYIDKKTFYYAWKDMKTSQRMLFSRFGFKKRYFNKHMHNSVINVMSMPMKVNKYDEYDILNDSHQKWADCLTNQERHESIKELVTNAQKELIELQNIIFNASKNEDISKELSSFVHNIDHDGFKVNSEKIYYSLLWK